jgi:putative tricarboxylic transport membrane protein
VQRILTSKDFLLGVVYIAIGMVYGTTTLLQLPLGSALNMGSGYFPIILSGALVLIGLVVGFHAVNHHVETIDFRKLPWRAIFLISGATLFFALTVRELGLPISAFLTVMIASFAARATTFLSASVTATLLAAFCSVVFVWGMELPIGLLGTWFD